MPLDKSSDDNAPRKRANKRKVASSDDEAVPKAATKRPRDAKEKADDYGAGQASEKSRK